MQLNIKLHFLRQCYALKGHSAFCSTSDDFYQEKYKDILPKYYQLTYNDKIAGYATREGCNNYISLRSRQEICNKHFRTNYHNQLNISSIGIGSYIGAPDQLDDLQLFGSLIDSIASGGVNHIDTAINYRQMKSERTIGAAIRFLFENTKIQRNELFIASKIGLINFYSTFLGYIPSDGDRDIQEYIFIESLLAKGLLKQTDIAGLCHSMHPKFLEQQLELSLNNLGLETLDLIYLHNPAESQLPVLGETKFFKKLLAAFEFFEKQVQLGKIRQYGIATWVCFRTKKEDKNLFLNLQDVVKIAEQVAGKNHHFNYVQTPINIMMSETFAHEWQEIAINNEKKNIQFLAAAEQLKINVVSSSPLMNGQLISLTLPPEIFKCKHSGARHLQFVRSIPYESLKTTLIGQKSNNHTKENLEVLRHPTLSPEEFWNYIKPKKRKTVS